MNYYACEPSRLVKWLDDSGGHHTGHVMLTHDGVPVSDMITESGEMLTLCRESCDGRLTWVLERRLTDWLPRSKWEDGCGQVAEQAAGG